MSPLSAPVLGGAALVSAPALWSMLDDTAPASVALTRFLVCLLLAWVSLEVVALIVGPAPAVEHPGDGPGDGTPDPGADL